MFNRHSSLQRAPTLARVIECVLNAQLPADCKVIVVHVDGLIGSEPLFDRQVAAVPMLVHHSVVYVGNGAARRAGIARASGDIVIVQHGDLEYDPGVTTAS